MEVNALQLAWEWDELRCVTWAEQPVMASSSTPTVFPSPSPSPTLEISYHELQSTSSTDRLSYSRLKGRGGGLTEDDGNRSTDALQLSSQSTADTGSYPPTSTEEAETRRVQEVLIISLFQFWIAVTHQQTLWQWELAEKQRKKAARESQRTFATPSLFETFLRRTSLLRSGSKLDNSRPSTYNGVSTISLTKISLSPTRDSGRTPAQLPRDPFADDLDPINEGAGSKSRDVDFAAQSESRNRSSLGRLPPPTPLGLPPPKTPPPIHEPPIMAPVIPRDTSMQEQELEARWWHEWLCGCGEGRDRGGDHQVWSSPSLIFLFDCL